MKNYLFGVLMLFPLTNFAASSIEITGAVGYTVVDLDQKVKEDENANTSVDDWDQMNSGVGVQYFFTSIGNAQVGAELMYQYLYWYQVRIPFGTSPIRREYGVSTTRITPVFRFGSERLAFDIGPEINFIDGASVGLMASANYYIPVSNNISIPTKLRIDVFSHVVPTIAASFNVGVRYNFD